MLRKNEKHWWAIPDRVLLWLTLSIPKDAKVLDVGPGTKPFKRADTYVDFIKGLPSVDPEKLVICDFQKAPLPFIDKTFDFIYCRHVIEDMHDPAFLLQEMSRVGKEGYIETPSPLAELCRGIDGTDRMLKDPNADLSPPYRGYHHHRQVVWADGDVLKFVTKYSLVEYMVMADNLIEDSLRTGPKFWNTYFHWKDEIKFKHYQNPKDFEFFKGYADLLAGAVNQSSASTHAFWTEKLAQYDTADVA